MVRFYKCYANTGVGGIPTLSEYPQEWLTLIPTAFYNELKKQVYDPNKRTAKSSYVLNRVTLILTTSENATELNNIRP